MDIFAYISNEDLEGMRHKIANGGHIDGIIYSDMYMTDYTWDRATPLIAAIDHFGDDVTSVSYIEAICYGGGDIDKVCKTSISHIFGACMSVRFYYSIAGG